MTVSVEAKCISTPTYNYHWQSDLFFEVHAAEDGNTKFPKSRGGQEGHTGGLRTHFYLFWLVTIHAFSFFFFPRH